LLTLPEIAGQKYARPDVAGRCRTLPDKAGAVPGKAFRENQAGFGIVRLVSID
jgi:hypothetical protein